MMGLQDGLDHALRALAALRERRDDWHALFLGDGDALPEMRRLAEALGVDDVVAFTGFVGHDVVRRALASADVCISPEPSSPLNDVSTLVKVAEYMAMARPIVAYDLPETRATAGDAALYAEASDPAGLAANLDLLLSDPVRRQALGRRGRERVERGLSWDSSVGSLYAAYERVLADLPIAFQPSRDARRASAA
jgi:glycosyltransferase involved in cell wall biosynthesis